MELEHVVFFEAAFVKQHRDALARCKLAFGVLLVDGFLATAEARFLTELDELLYSFCLFAHNDLKR